MFGLLFELRKGHLNIRSFLPFSEGMKVVSVNTREVLPDLQLYDKPMHG